MTRHVPPNLIIALLLYLSGLFTSTIMVEGLIYHSFDVEKHKKYTASNNQIIVWLVNHKLI